MSPIISLLIAIGSEIAATTSLKLSAGFTRLVPSILVVVGYASAFYFLSLTLKGMSLGSAYAIWSALGTVGAVVIGILVWRDPVTAPRIIGILLVIVGVVILNLYGEGSSAAQ